MKLIKPSKSNKKFRLYSKKLFLTYSRIPNNFCKENIKNQIKNKFLNFSFSYLIAFEKHKAEIEEDKTKNLNHIHMFLEFETRKNIISPTFLDLTIENKTYHGNYQSAKNRWHIIKYLIKEGNYITNMFLPIIKKKLYKPEKYIYTICKEQGKKKAMEELVLNFPEIAIKQASRFKTNLEIIQKVIFEKKEDLKFLGIENFKIPNSILEWQKNKQNLTLILEGSSGIGKTELAKSLLKEKFPLFIRDINQIKNFKEDEHKSILFDDPDFSKFTREQKIHLLDNENPSDIRILFDSIRIPSGITKIITANNLKNIIDLNIEELNRRVYHVNLGNNILFIQNKINIEINLNNE